MSASELSVHQLPCVPDPAPPATAAWGMGVDSIAMIEWIARGRPLDVVLAADTGLERSETYEFPTVSLHVHVETLGGVTKLALDKVATIGVTGPLDGPIAGACVINAPVRAQKKRTSFLSLYFI